MNRTILKGFVGCGALFIALSACTSVKEIAGFLGIRNTSEKAAPEERYMTFLRTIRPARGNPDSHYYLARYYQDRGNHREALIGFEKTIAIDPGHVKALNAMGVSYDYLKQFGRASECYRAALKLDPNAAYVYNNMGQSLFLQGNYVSAIEAMKKASALEGTNPRIHNNLGRAYAGAGRYDLAMAEFDQGGRNVPADSTLDRALHEAEGQPPAREATAAAAGDGTNGFAARVSRFLRERSAADVRHRAATLAKVWQEPSKEGITAGVCVEVSNGNGVDGMARNVGDYLRKKGFRVTRVTNAGRFDVAGTRIYYEKDHAQTANLLAGQMPDVGKIEEVPRLGAPRIKVKLLLGKDMIRYGREFAEGRS
jgi:tetratricopeptide (TPR) repeat protein